ncbi:neuropeptide FF receptor 2-like [Lineus longissimus]|uniref:neuropeptide FF receptor 2-like n=1 Tax=Lineus longissimus TaxID=88925 RepID=UPI002B4CA9FD
MEQIRDYLEAQERLLHLSNLSNKQSLFNFSGANAILREFQNNLSAVHDPKARILTALYIPTFILAFCGNLLTIYVILKHRELRKVKNVFLVNLAFADIAVTIVCMPPQVGMTLYRLWIYGEWLCKLSAYLQGVSVTASVFTLSVMSIDRFLAAKQPRHIRRLTTWRSAAKTLVVIWGLPCIFIGPVLYVRTVKSVELPMVTAKFCVEDWAEPSHRVIYVIFLLIVTYALPSVAVGCSYLMIGHYVISADKRQTNPTWKNISRRVVRMLVVLVMAFIICWLPYNINSLTVDIVQNNLGLQILPFTLWLGHTHSAADPIIYYSLHKNLRFYMRDTLTSGCRNSCEKKNNSNNCTPVPLR